MFTSLAMATAVSLESPDILFLGRAYEIISLKGRLCKPVIIITRIPADLQRRIASAASCISGGNTELINNILSETFSDTYNIYL